MPVSPRAARRRLLLVVVSVAALAVGAPTVSVTQAAPGPDDGGRSTPVARTEAAPGGDTVVDLGKAPRNDRLGTRDRQALARARDAGRRTVTVLVATARGRALAVSREVSDLGGAVGYRSSGLGYLRAVVPTAAVERTAKLPGVFGVDLNQRFQVPDPRPEGTPSGVRARVGSVAAPGPDTAAVNPYLPTHEIGAPQFVRRHPRWDGRGVTIGVLDTGVDLDHPALRTTTTGEPKVVDWVTATDPLVDDDRTWRPMQRAVTGPRFRYAGRTWTAPAGRLRVNLFDESATEGSELGGDVNRDGDTTDAWGVLYRPADDAVWVDIDDDGDFTDEELRRPFREGRQVGHFGRDDPSTPQRESMPFVVELRQDVDLSPVGGSGTADFVNIGIVSDSHGSHVAGVAAGHRLLGGAMSGAAPGARLVSSRACAFGDGCSATAMLEGMIDLVVRRGVDVVNMSIGGLPALNDGTNVRATVYNRLIADHGVQIFLSAGNEGPGLNTVGDPSVATDAVSVAASVSRATWLSNYGARVSAGRTMFGFSSGGPREDGLLKPDLSAPGAAVSTTPTWLPGRPVAEAGYDLPPGYSMFNGTSMAAPAAAGGAALLVSAGKAADVPVTPSWLRTSMYSTADFHRRIPSYAQGMGQLRVGSSWRLLRRVAAAAAPTAYDVSAPVCSPLSSYLATPSRGPGIHDRCPAAAGGSSPRRTRTYHVEITRRSGPAGSRVHALRWRGNDGTFSAPATVRLPLDRTVVVRVRVRARADVGAHGAILLVDDRTTPGVERAVSAVVVSATALSADDPTWSVQDRVGRSRTRSYFLTVPEGVEDLRVRLSDIAAGSQLRFLAFHPYGIGLEDNSSLGCYTHFSDATECAPTSRSYAQPTPGVWELTVEARRTTPYLDNPFSLTASLRGVALEPRTTEVPSAGVGELVPLSWTLTNRLAPVTVHPRAGGLGSAVIGRPSIADGDTDVYSVDVPAGTARLDVAIGDPGDPGADLDLTVLRDGEVVGQSADGDSEESVSLHDPAAGSYRVEVLGYDVPAGTTAYDYRDVLFAEGLGSLQVEDTPVHLGRGEVATLRGSITPRQRPAPGRIVLGEVLLTDPDGGVLGRADVLLRDVTP